MAELSPLNYTEQQLRTLHALAKAQGKTIEDIEHELLTEQLDRITKVVPLKKRDDS